jgi:hypothetical protein
LDSGSVLTGQWLGGITDFEAKVARLWFRCPTTLLLCQRNEHSNQEWVSQRVCGVVKVKEEVETVYPREIHAEQTLARSEKTSSIYTSFVMVEACEGDSLASRAPE